MGEVEGRGARAGAFEAGSLGVREELWRARRMAMAQRRCSAAGVSGLWMMRRRRERTLSEMDCAWSWRWKASQGAMSGWVAQE